MPNSPLEFDDRCQELAKTTLGENPVTKAQHIETIRKWIRSLKYLECRTDDEFILRFLRVSKFNCDSAKERIEKFCIGRSSQAEGMPEWYEHKNVDDKELMEMFRNGLMYPLPGPDDDGRVVVLAQYGHAAKHDPMKWGQARFMMFDYIAARYPRSQVNGVRLIESAEGVNPEHMKYWDLERGPKFYIFLQYYCPVSVQKIDWFHMPEHAENVIQESMRAMKSEMKAGLARHTEPLPPAGVPKNILPPSFGGTGPEWEEIREGVLNDMRSYKSEYESLKMCKIIDSKRPK